MGWLFTVDSTKKEQVAHLTEAWSTKDRRIQHNLDIDRKLTHITYFNAECLRHCYRGNAFSGILWTVWEWKHYDILTDEFVRSERWIGCYKLRYEKCHRGWGYKDMDEQMHPYYYSCPLRYLALVPKVASEEWREGVRKYHEIRNRKYEIGDILKFEGCRIPWAVVVNKRPLVAVYNGSRYKIRKALVDRVITPEELEQEKQIAAAIKSVVEKS